MFNGYTQETFEFFMAIRFNNNKEFFQANRDWYAKSVREPSLALAGELAETVEKIDPDLERRPYRALSHINRDVRFSHDKSPYRDYLWITFRYTEEKRKGRTPELYFEVSDEGASCGMGFYRDNPAMMKVLRRRAQIDPDALNEAVAAVNGYQLFARPNSRVKEVPEALCDPAREIFTAKTFYISRPITDFDLIRSPGLSAYLKAEFERMAPLYNYLSDLMEEAEQ